MKTVPTDDQPALVRPLILHDFCKRTWFEFQHNGNHCPFGFNVSPPTVPFSTTEDFTDCYDVL